MIMVAMIIMIIIVMVMIIMIIIIIIVNVPLTITITDAVSPYGSTSASTPVTGYPNHAGNEPRPRSLGSSFFLAGGACGGQRTPTSRAECRGESRGERVARLERHRDRRARARHP